MAPSSRSTHRSPKRRPLHERSDSQSNEIPAQTIRLLQDQEQRMYLRDPYPTQSSQVFTPGRRYMPVFDDEDNLFHHGYPTKEEASAPPPLRIRKKTKDDHHASSASESEMPSLYSSADFSGVTVPSSPPLSGSLYQTEWNLWKDHHQGSRTSSGAIDEAVRDLLNPASSSRVPAGHSTMRRPSTNPSNPSNISVASSASSDTLEPRLHATTRRQSSAYRYSSLLPPIQTLPAGSRASFDGSKDAHAQYPDSPGPQSPASLASEDRISISEHDGSSRIPHHAVFESSSQLQYPVVQPPASSASWADSSITVPKRYSQFYDSNLGRHPHWTPQLPNVPAEREQSPGPNDKGKQPIYPARGRPRRDTTGSTIRVVKEKNPASSPKRQKQSRPGTARPGTAGLASIPSVTSPPSSRGVPEVRPSSRSSFLIHGIPLWARIYYSRYGRDGSQPATPTNVRPFGEGFFPYSSEEQRGGQSRTDSAFGMGERTAYVPEPKLLHEEPRIQGSPRSDVWSPHLQPDKQAGTRKSYWKPPPVSPKKGRKLVNRRNMEVAAFCIGFIFPLAWMAAAFLPLPRGHALEMQGVQDTPDVEAATIHSVDFELYQNARWWRNVNRGMSLIGLLIIAAIITLAVVGVHP